MNLFDTERTSPGPQRAPYSLSDLDAALTAQIVVAWAGEVGDEEEPRLRWWRSDLVSEFGGADLLARLTPSTWRWSVLQAAREAARRQEAAARRVADDPDAVVSLFGLGFELDERIEERLQHHKRSGQAPEVALPGLEVIRAGWDPQRFWEWVSGHGEVDVAPSTLGRRLAGAPPAGLMLRVHKLVAALAPPADIYPMPYFKRSS